MDTAFPEACFRAKTTTAHFLCLHIGHCLTAKVILCDKQSSKKLHLLFMSTLYYKMTVFSLGNCTAPGHCSNHQKVFFIRNTSQCIVAHGVHYTFCSCYTPLRITQPKFTVNIISCLRLVSSYHIWKVCFCLHVLVFMQPNTITGLRDYTLASLRKG